MPLEFIKSNKGRDLLLVEGYTFRREKEIKGKKHWKCTDYDRFKCRARCHTEGQDIVTVSNHNHVPDAAKVEVRKTMEKVKAKATTTQESTHQIVAGTLRGTSTAVAGQLPHVRSIKQTVRRARRHDGVPLANPANIDDLVIPDVYKKTMKGDDFLKYDSGSAPNRILIFTTSDNLKLMSECPNWYADGTFKCTPPLFNQLYTIHAVKYSSVIPTVFILMTDRSTNSYVRVLTALNQLKPNLQPKSVMTDFEQAALLAFKTVYPGAEQRGCLFHMGQCIWKKIQAKEELRQRYTSDPEFALCVRQILSLAFVPVSDVAAAFDALLESAFFTDNGDIIRDLVIYFEDNWIGRPARRGGRSAPLFAHALWNCFDAVLQDLPRTNNSVEGWHRGFSELIGANHPTIWKFIDALKTEQNLNEMKIEQYIAGQLPNPSRRIYRETADKIKSIVADYTNRHILDYLRGIGHNLSLQM
jgi:hypothetical protein